jgi:hypothetical protein
MIALSPGWSEKAQTGEEREGVSSVSNAVPLMWYGWKIPRQKINTQVYVNSVASTLAAILGIAKPNAAISMPIELNY